MPIVRHGLLISDNPPTREPRRVVTGADGTVAINLAPGSYIVESDRPVAFLGQAYQWTTFVEVVAGRDTALALTAKNAEVLSTTATGPGRHRRSRFGSGLPTDEVAVERGHGLVAHIAGIGLCRR